jgi:membrane-associated phospholipid phosphatase
MSGHLIQLPLILPFYNLILLKEVWFVKAQPDLLLRNFATKNDMLVTVMNCFPSMHTSIAFAMLLLALRQQDKWFKGIMILYCASIAFSTLYLQIHWVLDIPAGMVLGYVSVKLIDLIINTVYKRIPASIKDFYTKKKTVVPAPKNVLSV